MQCSVNHDIISEIIPRKNTRISFEKDKSEYESNAYVLGYILMIVILFTFSKILFEILQRYKTGYVD